jgi:competence ComEA-like helix-hairpin-helix protein
MRRDQGSVLIGVLWCLALLSVVVISLLHTSRIDLQVEKNFGDGIQARYLALAGIERAKALIYQERASNKKSATAHSTQLYDNPRLFKAQRFGRGQYEVIRAAGQNERGPIVYGISDEEGRLNVNYATADELKKLYGIQPDTVAAIMDWRDADNNVTPGGAEIDYYASMPDPYLPGNAPIKTIRELLMVSGVTARDLFDEDANQNGLLDPEEDDGSESAPMDNADGVLDAGWSELLTVSSMTENVSASGEERVNVQNADEAALTRVQGISPEIAKAIVAYRGQNQLQNLVDLLDVAAPQARPQSQSTPVQASPGASPGGASGQPSAPQTGSPQAGTAQTLAQPGPAQPGGNTGVQFNGPKLIDENLLMEVADELTTSSDSTQPGLVNINSASAKVLACLPGITDQLADAIVGYRSSAGSFPNIAVLLRVPGITREIFKQVAPRITARSETYRIISEGRVKSSGATKRIEVIVHLGKDDFETLQFREDL